MRFQRLRTITSGIWDLLNTIVISFPIVQSRFCACDEVKDGIMTNWNARDSVKDPNKKNDLYWASFAGLNTNYTEALAMLRWFLDTF